MKADGLFGVRASPVSHSTCALARVAWPHRSTSTSRGEPAQLVAVIAPHEERRLRQVHLACNVLHPALGRRFRQHAHGGGIAGERCCCKGVDLVDVLGHVHDSSGDRFLDNYRVTVSLPIDSDQSTSVRAILATVKTAEHHYFTESDLVQPVL